MNRIAVIVSVLLIIMAQWASASHGVLTIDMSQATYRSGEIVRFWVTLSVPDGEDTGIERSAIIHSADGDGAAISDPVDCLDDAVVHAWIWHLTTPVAHFTVPANGRTSWEFTWQLSTVGQGAGVNQGRGADDGYDDVNQGRGVDYGYGVEAWIEACGEVLALTESAFDVSDDWTTQPRYGFFSEFGVLDESQARSAIQMMNRLHINAIQFYDWQYRHDDLVPPTERFVDSLGRPLLTSTIERKIALAREYGMAPMAYTAIYAASPSFYQQHQHWGLYSADRKPIDFGDGYLYLMDPSRGSGWDAHMIDQYQKTLHRFDFAGIHIDQYGYPTTAYNAAGGRVFLAHAFRTFLDDTKAALSEAFDRNIITFNSVTNWPTATVAKSRYDFNYVEVWPPYVTYGDIERIIRDAYIDSSGKATVIAAYVDPENEATVKLLDAVIFAHGATHIEIGEGDGMLADPYFPLFRRVSPSLWQDLISYYDFLVRYRQWLAAPRTALNAAGRVWIDGRPVSLRPEPGYVHPILYALQDGRYHTLSLINFTKAQTVEWRAQQPEPDEILGLSIKVALDVPPQAVWFASPDRPTNAAVALPFTVAEHDGQFMVELVLPSLHYWSVLVFDLGGGQ